MPTFVRFVPAAMLMVSVLLLATGAPAAESDRHRVGEVLQGWYGLVLKLVRHTPTYSPPVASRSLAYLGVTSYEAIASGSDQLRSLAGQLNGLGAVPAREPDAVYDDAVVLEAAMATVAGELFANTGPTGQRVLTAFVAKLSGARPASLAPEVVSRSEAYGRSVAAHILEWSRDDAGGTVENMGFPLAYQLTEGPSHWVPTSLIAQQQRPLLPAWGRNRAFAMPDGAACPLPPPPEYSESKDSPFYKQALEVYETVRNLTPEQRAIARFWSDDPMLSPTPPGHWISIALQIIDRDDIEVERSAEILARLGITLADAFIGCWHSKYQYDLLRPVTYIHRVIDPAWQPVLNTPPFPEYPSGHSTQSAAAATVLTASLGESFAFDDATHRRDGVPGRTFASFWDAANEAGISRLYGGIHFREAIERGLDQGRCIGAYANALRTRG